MDEFCGRIRFHGRMAASLEGSFVGSVHKTVHETVHKTSLVKSLNKPIYYLFLFSPKYGLLGFMDAGPPSRSFG